MPTTSPKELDLNLTKMREDALSELVAMVRAFIHRIDEIDILERVLNRQTPLVARQATKEAGTSRNGTEPAAEPEPTEPKRIQRSKPRVIWADIREAALEILRKYPKGVATDVLVGKLRGRAIPASANEKVARQMVTAAMAKAREQKLVRAIVPPTYERTRGAQSVYFLVTPGRAKPARPVDTKSAAKSAATSAPKKIKARELPMSMRDAVVKVMRTHPEGTPVRPIQITKELIASGWPQMYTSNPLNNHVNWAFTHLLKNGTVTKTQQDGKTAYILNRTEEGGDQ